MYVLLFNSLLIVDSVHLEKTGPPQKKYGINMWWVIQYWIVVIVFIATVDWGLMNKSLWETEFYDCDYFCIWGEWIVMSYNTLVMFTLCRIALAPARKPYRVGLLFTLKNGDFSAISVTGWSCVAPISKVERHISDGFCVTLWCSVHSYSDSSGSE